MKSRILAIVVALSEIACSDNKLDCPEVKSGEIFKEEDLPTGSCSGSDEDSCSLRTTEICPDGNQGQGKTWKCMCKDNKWSCEVVSRTKTGC